MAAAASLLEPAYAAALSSAPYRRASSYFDLLNPVVHRFGKWGGAAAVGTFDPVAGMFDPVVVLLDGVRGRDPMSTWLIDACSAHGIRVAVIDLATTRQQDRFALYGAIDRLRAMTPLASANVVMTMDSNTVAARDYIAEIKDLGILGAWEAKSKLIGFTEFEDLATVDIEAWRGFFVASGAGYACLGAMGTVVDAQRRLFASRVASALSGVAAARAAEAASSASMHVVPLPGEEPENQPTELRAAANKFMGHLFCFDFADNATIGKELSRAGVRYVPKAIKHMKSGLPWTW